MIGRQASSAVAQIVQWMGEKDGLVLLYSGPRAGEGFRDAENGRLDE